LHEARDLLELTSKAMPEGFAVCRVIRDRSGRAVDFRVEWANAAFGRMSQLDADPVGRRLPEAMPPGTTDWTTTAMRVFKQGRPEALVCKAPTGTPCEVRFARAGAGRLSVLITDRTEFEREEHRHAERLMELNHRTKNNLANVAGMLRLQGRRAADPAVREQLTKAANRVDAVSNAYESLYRFGSREVVDLGVYLTDLCDRLARALVDNERVSLEVEAATVAAQFEDVLPLGIIVNELVTNAAKYAYPEPMVGAIHVRLGQTADGIAVTVWDEGCGPPPSPDTKPGGLGLHLVRSLVRQMEGRIHIRPGHPGMAVEVRLPWPKIQDDGAPQKPA
jgi:two-component sensor histidine kinase